MDLRRINRWLAAAVLALALTLTPQAQATTSLSAQVLLATNQQFVLKVQTALVNTAIAISNETVNEVQTITFGGTVTGGTYTLTFAGQTTTALTFNAAPGAVAAALGLLTTVNGVSNVVVTGGPGPTNMVVTYSAALGNSPQTLLTATSSLTGTSPTVTVVRTTAGVAVVNHAMRQQLASNILNNPGQYAALFAWGVAGNATVQADWWNGSAPILITPPINTSLAADQTDDTNINNAISANFNSYAH